MTILCRHVQVYTLGRLTIDGFSFERVGQFNREWIFIQLYSGFQSLVGFRILSAVFRIPRPRIPDSGSKKFLDSGIRIPLHRGIHYSWRELKNQGLPAGARWKNRKNVLASANEIQANLLLITKRFHIQEMLDCIVFSSFDVRVIR